MLEEGSVTSIDCHDIFWHNLHSKRMAEILDSGTFLGFIRTTLHFSFSPPCQFTGVWILICEHGKVCISLQNWEDYF